GGGAAAPPLRQARARPPQARARRAGERRLIAGAPVLYPAPWPSRLEAIQVMAREELVGGDQAVHHRRQPFLVERPHVVPEAAVELPEIAVALLAAEQAAIEAAHALDVELLIAAVVGGAPAAHGLGAAGEGIGHLGHAAGAVLVDAIEI